MDQGGITGGLEAVGRKLVKKGLLSTRRILYQVIGKILTNISPLRLLTCVMVQDS